MPDGFLMLCLVYSFSVYNNQFCICSATKLAAP